MPEIFIDRSVQYPKRFTIQANGLDGTDSDISLDGKVVAFNINPGIINEQGTSLNAEELNKRIIGDFEDKTFTELRTLLDTLNIDKDQNANMVVNKILMRTAYQMVVNGNAGNSWIGDNNGSKLAMDSNGDLIINNVYTPGNQTFNIISGRKYLGIVETDTDDALSGLLRFYYDNAVVQNFNNPGVSRIVKELITATDTGLANFAYVEGSILGSIAVLEMMLIDVTELSDKGLTDAEIIGNYETYFEGKAKTVNPHLLTIGQDKSGLDLAIADLGYDYNDVVQNAAMGNTGLDAAWVSGGAFTIQASELSSLDIKFSLDTGVTGIHKLVIKDEIYTLVTFGNFSAQDGNNAFAISNTGIMYIAFNNLAVKGITKEVEVTAEAYLQKNNVQFTFETASELTNAEIAVNAAKDFYPAQSNIFNKYGFQAEGNSVTYDGETIEDLIELRNNRYIYTQKILEDEANFQAIGGVAGNWFYDGVNANFEIDFATLGIDPPVSGNISFARIIIDGKVYTNDLSVSDLKFVYQAVLTSGNPGLLIKDLAYASIAAWAAFIAAATEIVYDFLMKTEDFVETVIQSTGFTVIEENGTIVEENEEGIAFETETEIPVNIPAAILEIQKDVRRLFNIKMEAVMIEDFSELALDVPSLSTASFIELTDNNDFDLYYAMIAHESNSGLVVPVYFTKVAGHSGLTVIPEPTRISAFFDTINMITTQVTIKYDKSTLKFTIGGSVKTTQGAATLVDDDTTESKVYAVYGLRAAKGDPRND